MYYIYHEKSGIQYPANSKTLLGAKRQASADASYGGGTVYILDGKNGMALCKREFYATLQDFWWSQWENC